MDTSHINKVKAPQHVKTPRSDLARHLEGEHQFMPLEDARARVVVDVPHDALAHVP